jgi:hypothetical protein
MIATLLWVAASLAAPPFVAPATETPRAASPSPPGEEAESLQIETERLAAELVPTIVRLNGFRSHGPVKIEATTKAVLGESLVPSLREFYGPDELKRRGRVLAALGLLPEDYDLEAGFGQLHLEVMGGGYDPLRGVLYVLLDLPPGMRKAPARAIVAAHEITHALQDQHSDMRVQMRRGVTDWDHEFLYNCVLEGMAYVTMMAVTGRTSLPEAPDPGPMLEATRAELESGSTYSAFARSPRYLKEKLFGPAILGVSFCRTLVRGRPAFLPATLLDTLPASGEQILHYDRYVANDRPTAIDLSALDEKLPAGWRPYYANALGEFDIRMMFEGLAATKETATRIAEGWDGCRFRAFEDDEGRLIVLGLSAWDTESDAEDFASALGQVAAERAGGERTGVARSGTWVRFVIGSREPGTRETALSALAEIAGMIPG